MLTSWGPYTATITLVLPISNKADLTATNQGLAQPKSSWLVRLQSPLKDTNPSSARTLAEVPTTKLTKP
jgi:hypothetical protein